MALNKYIYKDIQPEITETFPNLHVDDEKLISLFKEWGFDIIINGNVSWNLTFVQNNGYAIGFNQYQAIKIKKPHRYVDQITFKNINKSIKQEQNVTDGNYILVTNPTIYLSEISYRMDATNCYLWSVYGNGQFQSPTQQNVNFLKNLRLQVDTDQLNPENHSSVIYVNPSFSQKYQYSRNSKYGFNGHYGDFIHLKTDSDLIKPNVKIKGQYNYDTLIQGTHPIEEGQYWGTESNEKIIDVLYNDFNSSNMPVPPTCIYNEEDDSYTINDQKYYFPHDTKFYLIKKVPGSARMENGFLKDPSNPTPALDINDGRYDRPASNYALHSPPDACIQTYTDPSVIQDASFIVGAQSFQCYQFDYSEDMGQPVWSDLPEWLNHYKTADIIQEEIDPFNKIEILRKNLRDIWGSNVSFDMDSSLVWFYAWSTQRKIKFKYRIDRFTFLPSITKTLNNNIERIFNVAMGLRTYNVNNVLHITHSRVSNYAYCLKLTTWNGIVEQGFFDLYGFNTSILNSFYDYIQVVKGYNGESSSSDYYRDFYILFRQNINSTLGPGTATPEEIQYFNFPFLTQQEIKTYGRHNYSENMYIDTSPSHEVGYVLIAVRDPIPDRTL